jgi:hypothetical protein
MTVIKTIKLKTLGKNKIYRRADLFGNLEWHENMASTYYDPNTDELYTFFNEKSKDWKNIYLPKQNELHYSHRREPKLVRCPKWELTKKRHIFLHEKDMKSGDFKYLGTTIGENIKTIVGIEVRVMALK